MSVNQSVDYFDWESASDSGGDVTKENGDSLFTLAKPIVVRWDKMLLAGMRVPKVVIESATKSGMGPPLLWSPSRVILWHLHLAI